jgi:hypothetical protein
MELLVKFYFRNNSETAFNKTLWAGDKPVANQNHDINWAFSRGFAETGVWLPTRFAHASVSSTE